MNKKFLGLPLWLILAGVGAFFFRKQLGGLFTKIKDMISKKDTPTT